MIIPGISRDLDVGDPIYEGSNFDWGEATKDFKRVPPNATVTANIIKLAKRLDEIRIILGNRPIIIISWYRDPRSNRIVGGVPDSRHLIGDAADIQVRGLKPRQVQSQLEKIWTGGMGYGETYTHLDNRSTRTRWHY